MLLAVIFIAVAVVLGGWLLLVLGRAVFAEVRTSDPVRAVAIAGVTVIGLVYIAYIVATGVS